MSAEERIERARLLYERAVIGGDASALAVAEREPDAVEADLALARGRVVHARFLEQRNEDLEPEGRDASDAIFGVKPSENPNELALFERAARLYQTLGDVRGEAESLFWIGTFHQIVRRDNDAAVSALERSYELAAQVGDK